MKSKRRTFIKTLGLSGVGTLSSLRSGAYNKDAGNNPDKYKNRIEKIEKRHVQRFNMLTCPPKSDPLVI